LTNVLYLVQTVVNIDAQMRKDKAAQEAKALKEAEEKAAQANVASTQQRLSSSEAQLKTTEGDLQKAKSRVTELENELKGLSSTASRLGQVDEELKRVKAIADAWQGSMATVFTPVVLYAEYGGMRISHPNVVYAMTTALDNRVRFQVTNESMGGDPMPGRPKSCRVVYYPGRFSNQKVPDGMAPGAVPIVEEQPEHGFLFANL
jgi:hypothetical protein